MLGDAVATEAIKLLRNRWTCFWAFGFVPLAALAINLFSEIYLRDRLAHGQLALLVQSVDLGHMLLGAVGQAAGPMTFLFCLVGAATLFAGEYRWETWRLMTPRLPRRDVWTGKIVVLAVAVALTIVALGLSGVLTGLASSLIGHRPLVWDNPGFFGRLSVRFLIAWLQVVEFCGLAAVAGALTRSLMGAVFAPIAIAVAQGFVQGLAGAALGHPKWWHILALPGLAANILSRAFEGGGPVGMAGTSTVGWSVASLLLWLALGFGGGLLIVLRQDLARE